MSEWVSRFPAAIGAGRHKAEADMSYNPVVDDNADGGTPGWLRVSARTPGTSFTITSSSGTDTSTVAYQIFEPG